MPTAQEEKYIRNLRAWLVDGDRYFLSFPRKFEATRAEIEQSHIPNPEKDPIGAYKELTARLRDPTQDNVSLEAIMGTIDLSLLGPPTTSEIVTAEFQTAIKYGVASACLRGKYLAEALDKLKGTGVSVGQVIDFPNANNTTEDRVDRTLKALKAGAIEIDIPIDVGLMKEKNYEAVYKDLRAVWQVVHDYGGILKPIARVDDLETIWKADPAWNERESNPYIIKYCEIVNRLQADLPGGYHQLMAKTSTGFDFQTIEGQPGKDYRGATNEVLSIFAAVCKPGNPVGIKAAGKVRDAERFLYIMREFGVVRIGCTVTQQIAKELKQMKYYSHAA